MRHLLLIVAALCRVSSQSLAQQPESFVVRSATLDVAIDYDSARLSGSYTMELENWTAQPAARISFALNRLMDARRVTDAGGRDVPFTQDVLRFSDDPMRQVTQVVVSLPKPVAPGARTTIRVDYAGFLVPYTEVGWLYVKDHIDTAFTILREDALAFPTIQGLNDAANRRRPRPDFTYEASVRVPAGYMVATGGTFVRRPNADGTVTWSYKSGRPSPFLNIEIARYDTVSVPGLRVVFFPSDSAGARYIASNGDRALRLFGEWFGPLRDKPTVTLIEIPDDWGSQASIVGGIIQTASAFHDTLQINEVYHELAHLWNTVGDGDTPSPRWNEGLSSFLELLTKEKLNGWTGRGAQEQRTIGRLRERVATDSMTRTTPFADYGRRGITGFSYSVGRVMFSALHDLEGEAAFNRTFAELYRQYPGGATTRQFVDLAERQTPVDLGAFFDDWMFTTKWTQLVASSASVADIVTHYRR